MDMTDYLFEIGELTQCDLCNHQGVFKDSRYDASSFTETILEMTFYCKRGLIQDSNKCREFTLTEHLTLEARG
jgi:hypothetical protein